MASSAPSVPETRTSLDTSLPYFGLTADDYKKQLGLLEHPEGGFFVETYRSGVKPMSSGGRTSDDPDAITMTVERTNDDGSSSVTMITRQPCTLIYWMQDALTSPVAKLHCAGSTSIDVYNAGYPTEMILVDTDSWTIHRKVIGPDVRNGQQLQVETPAHWWKCMMCLKDFSLLSETCCPGFDYRDWSLITPKQVRDSGLTKEEKTELLLYTAKESVGSTHLGSQL